MQKQIVRVAAIAAVLAVCRGAWGWYPYGEKYSRWQAKRPMLFAGLHNVRPSDRLPERIARFKAAGLNTFVWVKPGQSHQYFRAADAAGLEWACWHRGREEQISKAMAIPGNSFIMTGDEPNTDKLKPIAELSEWVRETYPDTPAFANLAIPKVDHDLYIRMCKPDVFSFDHYPLQRNGETQDTWLYNLNWGRQTSMRHRLPYWMYLQAYGRKLDRPTYAYRNPGAADIRFLVFSFLAHGGTGMQWFIYYGYEDSMVMDSEVADTARTPAEKHKYENSYPTRSWFAIRNVAPEVQNLARAIVHLRPKGEVGYFGNGRLWDHKAPTYPRYNPVVPFRCSRFAGHGALKSVQVLGADEMGGMVGVFDDRGGQEYFMVVNFQHGAKMSKMDGLRTLRLVFDKSVRSVERLNRLTGRAETLRTKAEADSRQLDIRLEGGTGDLFKWSNGKAWTLRRRRGH